jgi:AAA domain
MKLIEMKTTGLIKCLVYGEAGSGKTCFAAGWPLPIAYFDFDNKLSSAARFYDTDKERLKQIEVFNLSPQFATDPILEFTKKVEEMTKWQKSGEYPYKTLVIDSITTFSSAVLSFIVKSNPGINRVRTHQGVQPGMQDFGILKREFQRLIPGLLTLDMNIVMLGHVATEKDELTGELVRSVLMDGSFAAQLPIYFEEVYRSYAGDKDGKPAYFAQTRPDGKFSKIRSQIPGLPAIIPLKYDELISERKR